MKCTNCGVDIEEQRIRIPRKCNNCGTKFEMILNIGVIVYLILSLVSILSVMFLLKQIFSSEWILYVLLAFEIAIIPNIIEKKLLKLKILKYKNMK